jgi:endonuclease/exonuclease/phosphatase family metal-dependent hydrolase
MGREPRVRPRRAAIRLAGLAAAGVGGLLAWARLGEHRPADREPADIATTTVEAQSLRVGTPFRVVSWNLQFGAGRGHRFFYDGGEAVHVPPGDVVEAVSGISGLLHDLAPDLTLLQEVDRDSDRTARADQLPSFVQASGAHAWSAATYHKAPFIPHPLPRPLGRVQMDLAILSRGPIDRAGRIALPLLDEPRIRQMFNLKRAMLTAELPVEGLDQPLAIAVTHLSAFSYGDGTLEAQVAMLDDWMRARPPGQPWVLAGDLNLLPPGDDKGRLQTERDLYADGRNPIEALLPGHTEVFGDQLDPAHRTYLPFGAAEPDRKIDYLFVGGPIEVQQARVAREANQLSDHLPIVATLQISG